MSLRSTSCHTEFYPRIGFGSPSASAARMLFAMRSTAAAILVLAIVFAPSLLLAQATPSPALLALSKQGRTLAIVDPASLKVVAKVPVGNDPHEVIASADGKTAYVSNYGFGAFNTLAVIDLVAQKPLTPVDLGALRGP